MAMRPSMQSGQGGWLDALEQATVRKRILFTIAALCLSRVGSWVPLPGINPAKLAELLQTGNAATFTGFAGGTAIERLSVCSLALTPFVSAWLLTEVVGIASGRRDLGQFRRYVTAALATMQAYGVAVALEGVRDLVLEPGGVFRATTIVTLVAGTMALLWLGEEITRRGLGDGIWLIVTAQFVVGLPMAAAALIEFSRNTGNVAAVASVLAVLAGAVALIVLVETAERRVPLEANGGADAQSIPDPLAFPIDRATILPALLATMLLPLPFYVAALFAGPGGPSGWFATVLAWLGRGQPLHLLLFAALIALFTVIITAMEVSPDAIASRLRRAGASIPGVPPDATALHLDDILTRITVIGVGYLLALFLVPEVMVAHTALPVYIGGWSLLIAVLALLRVLADIGRAAAPRPTPSVGARSAPPD